MRWLLILMLLPLASADTLYLADDSGAGAIGQGPWLRADPGASATMTLAPALAGLGQGEDAAAWTWAETWDMDTEFTTDAVLSLQIQAAGSSTLEATLVDLAATGEQRTLAMAAHSLRPADAGSSVSLSMPTAGTLASEGHTLQLQLTVQGAGALTIAYGDASSSLSYATRPADTDADGIPDSLERAAGTDPFDGDDPGDGSMDTDGDGVPDAVETRDGTDPLVADSDGDGFDDGIERTVDTDPLNAEDHPEDLDGDGLPDAWEREHLGGLGSGPDDDLDDDGLTNLAEVRYGTDPRNADTDGDGMSDGDEVAASRNPLVDPNAPTPPEKQVGELVAGILLVAGTAAVAWIGLARRHAL